VLLPLGKVVQEERELERYGVEFVDLPIMASSLNSRESCRRDQPRARPRTSFALVAVWVRIFPLRMDFAGLSCGFRKGHVVADRYSKSSVLGTGPFGGSRPMHEANR
jgi:hypothetical protein